MRYGLFLACCMGLVSMVLPIHPAAANDFDHQRQQMLNEIREDARRTSRFIERDAFDQHIMQVLATVPRHEFVPDDQLDHAYENRPLPIGFGQTISQPYIVALMTDLLEPRPDHRVLEIGTGSGYQAAVLAQLVDQVYTIEIIEGLASRTRQLFKKLGYANIHTLVADGYNGWPEHAPYDSIIVTAAISHIPPPLVAQLNKGGRLVIPVGTRFQTQYLTLVEKDENGTVSSRKMLPVRFVPFTGEH